MSFVTQKDVTRAILLGVLASGFSSELLAAQDNFAAYGEPGDQGSHGVSGIIGLLFIAAIWIISWALYDVLIGARRADLKRETMTIFLDSEIRPYSECERLARIRLKAIKQEASRLVRTGEEPDYISAQWRARRLVKSKEDWNK